jgi:Mg2+ and Co2+ transporter CorA
MADQRGNARALLRALLLPILLALPLAMPAGAQDAAVRTGTVALSPSLIPIPDPSTITTQQIEKAKKELAQQFGEQLSALKELVQSALNAGGKESAAAIAARADLLDEKINSLKATESADKVASGEALVTALQAQKESVAARNLADTEAAKKAEDRFSKEIDDIQKLITLQTGGLRDTMTASNDRLTRLEASLATAQSQLAAAQTNRVNSSTDTGTILAAISLAVVLIGGVLVVFGFIASRGRTHA